MKTNHIRLIISFIMIFTVSWCNIVQSNDRSNPRQINQLYQVVSINVAINNSVAIV